MYTTSRCTVVSLRLLLSLLLVFDIVAAVGCRRHVCLKSFRATMPCLYCSIRSVFVFTLSSGPPLVQPMYDRGRSMARSRRSTSRRPFFARSGGGW